MSTCYCKFDTLGSSLPVKQKEPFEDVIFKWLEILQNPIDDEDFGIQFKHFIVAALIFCFLCIFHFYGFLPTNT